MPGSQTVDYEGFRIRVRPAFWLRRWTRWPLYFQGGSPSFQIQLARLPGEASAAERLVFEVGFGSTAFREIAFDVSDFEAGEQRRHTIGEVFLSYTGDTCLRLRAGSGEFHEIYVFYVSPETALVFLLLNVVFGVAFTTVVALALRFL
ncbi:unnamed protein product [marine sediment metagenome]|uniref:Uncharacterized protein n=1 Tax=marine sediment metagenome TaxID=412755 RepID=X0YQA3_9ZZZZ